MAAPCDGAGGGSGGGFGGNGGNGSGTGDGDPDEQAAAMQPRSKNPAITPSAAPAAASEAQEQVDRQLQVVIVNLSRETMPSACRWSHRGIRMRQHGQEPRRETHDPKRLKRIVARRHPSPLMRAPASALRAIRSIERHELAKR